LSRGTVTPKLAFLTRSSVVSKIEEVAINLFAQQMQSLDVSVVAQMMVK